MNKQSGISPILIIFILLVVAVGGWAIYTITGKNEESAQTPPEETTDNTTEDHSSDTADEPNTQTPAAPTGTTDTNPLPSNETPTPAPAVKEFNITAQNFSFSPREIRVKLGEKIKITFTSNGGFHDWTLDGYNVGTTQVNTGQSASVEFVADKAGGFEYYCSIGSHRAMGMVGGFIVE